MVLFTLVELVRDNPWLQRRILLRSFLLRIFRAFIHCSTLGKGTKKMIGNSAEFFLDPAFYFSDFSNWGSKHNSGFAVAINMCKGKKIFFDVGAHIGLYSLPAANTLERQGMVFAFEAATENIKYLASHKKRNSISNITIVPTLVGGTNENEVAFFESSGTNGMNSITEPRKRRDLYNKVFRKQISLDSFSEDQQLVPDIIKIDVEGAEGNVLRGSTNILSLHRPVIFLSLHPRHLEVLGESAADIVRFLATHNYELLEMNGTKPTQLRLEEYLAYPIERKKNVIGHLH